MTFELATTGRVIFGQGSVSRMPAIAAALGKRALVVIGRTLAWYCRVLNYN